MEKMQAAREDHEQDMSGVTVIAALAAMVAFGTGYIHTPTGQKALIVVTEARYLAPIDVFVISIVATIFFAIASRRIPMFEGYPPVFMMLATSSIADIILQCRGLAWIVYVPCVLTVLFLVCPLGYKCFYLIFCVLYKFLLDGIETVRKMAGRCDGGLPS